MSAEHPTPWRIEGDTTIRDAAGGVVVSALNPCDVGTRRLIVETVNELDTLKQRIVDVMEVCDGFKQTLNHVLDCMCYARQIKEADANTKRKGCSND